MTNENESAEDTQEIAAAVVPTVEEKSVDVNDVDASWDGTGTLDEHRQRAFAQLKQPGFGNIGKEKPDGK